MVGSSKLRKNLKIFIFILLVFSVGLFFGELLLDGIIGEKRDILKVEIRDSFLTALIVAILVVIGNKSLKKTVH